MHRRVKQGKGERPLLVKEIILPDGHGNSTSLPKNDKVIADGQETTFRSSTKAGQHEEEAFSLIALQETPSEDYFEGTRKGKKVRKRKMKHQRITIPPSEIFSDGAQVLPKAEREQQAEKALTEEEKTEIRLLNMKIYEYEKMREQTRRKNYARQKMAEEDYIRQLEELLADWFQTENRSRVTPESSSKKPHKKRNESSFTSRECCGDNSEPPGKSEKVFKEVCQPDQPQPTDILGDEFYQKLVLVDEDSDEFDYDGQNLQFRSLRKH